MHFFCSHVYSFTASPVIRRAPRDVEASLGATANFECVASGDPQPTVRWHRVVTPTAYLTTSSKYDVSSDGAVLVVRNLNAADDGEYECVAQNMAGMARATARLTVFGMSRDTRAKKNCNACSSCFMRVFADKNINLCGSLAR